MFNSVYVHTCVCTVMRNSWNKTYWECKDATKIKLQIHFQCKNLAHKQLYKFRAD